jgi:hypothetical protein
MVAVIAVLASAGIAGFVFWATHFEIQLTKLEAKLDKQSDRLTSIEVRLASIEAKMIFIGETR